jgi:hypothetical protein
MPGKIFIQNQRAQHKTGFCFVLSSLIVSGFLIFWALPVQAMAIWLPRLFGCHAYAAPTTSNVVRPV